MAWNKAKTYVIVVIWRTYNHWTVKEELYSRTLYLGQKYGGSCNSDLCYKKLFFSHIKESEASLINKSIIEILNSGYIGIYCSVPISISNVFIRKHLDTLLDDFKTTFNKSSIDILIKEKSEFIKTFP